MTSRLLLAPLIIGQRLSLAYYRRQCVAWNEVTRNVWIGRQLSNREAANAARQGVSAVLDLTAEFTESGAFLSLTNLNVPILDLKRCVAFISDHAEDGVVYVHCKIGYSRSAAVVAAYLIASGIAPSADEAIAQLKRARPSIVIRPEAIEAIRRFECESLDNLDVSHSAAGLAAVPLSALAS
jgi:protein phosphatase